MVRETRHLWVGNLPENIREDRIRDHFKRYGRVQSVKLLLRGEECPVDGGSSSSLGEGNEGGSGSNSGGGGGGGGSSSVGGGASATVAFMDIKSAAKAHAIEHTLDERTLTTQYYEPQHLQPRFASRGSSEDYGSSGGSGGGTGGVSGGGGGSGVGGGGGGGGGSGGSAGAGVGGSGTGGERGERGGEGFDSRGSHGSFYGSERNSRVVGGSAGVVVGHPADPATGDPGGYISRGRPPASSYHVTPSRARDRLYPRSGPYITGPPPPPPHLDRHRGSLPPSSWSAYEPTGSRYGGAPPPPSPATNDAYQDEQGVGGGDGSGSSTLRQHKKQRRKSRSGSSSPSGSSRSGSSSSSRSGSSGGSSSGSTSPGSPVSPHRTSNAAVADDRRPLAICVRNLPIRSSDTSLKDGLFHEYKKHGKVTWVKVVGSGDDRYALVCFKKPEDVEKALEVSQDKLFFGCKIEVAPYQGYDVEDNEFRPYEAELDEYHPKATRTLFIGNLEKDVTASELRKHFESFGEIIEIDIKKQGSSSSYAFCQYSDIGSVVKAMRSMDGEHLGANRIKLGFGKSMPTACVWVDGIGDGMSEKYLNMQFHQFGSINQVAVDRERGHALVFFDQISCAQTAVKEMRGAALRGRRLQVDFASRECQDTFYEHLERQGNSTEKTWESRPSPASSFDVTRERSSFDSAVTVSSSSSRFTRYDTPPRSRTASYSRTSGGSTPGASPAHPTAMSRSSRRSYQESYYDGDYGEPTPRRFRSYDEFSQGSGTSHDDYQSSVLSDGKLNDDECPPPSRRHTVQSVVTSVDPPAPPPPLLPPPDIRHLQKERVHLLEQLEECQSSGDEVGFVPKKRVKLDSSSATILCEDDEPEIASLLVTSHSSKKGMEFRRVSDSSKVVVHHGTRRSSCEGRGPAPCKRRRDATSRHHEHHDGSRPGTPLVDERPENLVPSEPRRFRERSHEGPLSLPLPRFAAQMLNNNNNNNNNNSSSNNNNGSGTARLSSASLSKVASPPCASLSTAPSPRAAPQPPASPPPRHTSPSPTSSDSETAPQSPTLEERIRSLDEMYEKWSGSRALSAASGDALAKLDASVSERFRFPHKLLENDYKGVEPSEIMKSVLAKRSVFEEDSKRLENFSEKYEPREFTGVSSMIGGTAGLTTGGGCTGKVCLQYPFPSHPPVQSTSGGPVNSQQVGVSAPLPASLAPTTTVAPSTLKADPRMVHICVHPTPATPITPGTSVKTVSPELPPVTLPIGLGSGTVASSGNGSGLASASSLLSSNGSVSNIHALGASTHRGLTALAAVPTDTFPAATTPVATTSSATMTTTTTSASATLSSMTGAVCSSASSITSSSNSSSLSASSQLSSTEAPRSRLKKENSGGSRESRDSREGKEGGRESKHNKGKDCQRRSLRKEEIDVERSRKDRDERESVANDISNADIHSRDFKDNKELRYERKERDKEDRDRQERKDKEDRDRQEKKEREEREKREKEEEMRERERLDKERQERDRKEREEREKERERKEKEENELKEKERREKERIDREKREREEKERQERREREERERKEREERERKEREVRLEREKQEKERLRREREEQERRDKEERERLERERRREEKERLERERKREREEKERLERERRKEKEERERAEKEKCEREERERLEKEKHEKEKHEKRREREDQEKREKEKMEREKRRDREEKEKEKRERDDGRRQSTENHLHSSVAQSQTQVVPAPVPVKRRCSSQDGPADEDAKRMKISDHRRDSKDRSRQNRRSEDRKHRNDSHRSSRESRENRDVKESAMQDGRDGAHGEPTREANSRDSKEKQRSKKNRSEKESRERSPRVSHESDKEYLSKLELSKRNDSSLSTESASNHTRDAQHHQQQQHSTMNSHFDMEDCQLSTHEMQVTRNPSITDTDSDEPKKHSIFDIVVDEPAYISMYDKVKARSTKNMQKLEEEKRQVRLKDKFSQLKQSRARREEKKQSTSWDGDSVSSKALTEDEATSESDSTRTKSLSRKGSRSRIHSDTSEEEEPFNNKVRKPVKTERFVESDVDFGFADAKQNSHEVPSVVVNSVHIKEEPRTSDEDERVSVGFRTNHSAIVNNHERDPRKKSHKKKQKRQKSGGNENSLKTEPTEAAEHKGKANAVTPNADCRPNHGAELNAIAAATGVVTTALENEERMRADKKQRSKKDKRRDRNGEDKAKARRKRLNRQEARDSQRMEDIFGPLSDDVDDASSTFFNRFGNIAAENNVYASDSDGGRSSLDMDRVRRKTEKKRRHQLEDENSVDLAEAGREIEAKLLGIPSSPKSTPACTEPSDHDVFRFTDDNDSVEPSTPSAVTEKVKEKKKKRKKSKEERGRKDYHHHHHHHHHHHEKGGELPYLGAEPSPPRASSPLVSKTPSLISPSLPTPRETLLSPIPKVTSSISVMTSITPPTVSSGAQAPKPEKKKDKLIPGFGIEMDETIHENAVKSISEPEEREGGCQSRGAREEPELPVQTTPTQASPEGEDKPRVAISQEETEDAVAALLEETFGASTEDFSYEGEEEEAEADGVAEAPAEAPQEDVEEMQQAVESLNASTGEGDADMKPDTPQSEHDLQIDTDTEEDPNYETVDLTQPPKTPDIPSFYKSPTKTLNMTPVLTAPEKPVEVRLSPPLVTKLQSPPTSVIAHSWTVSENKPRESAKPVQAETTPDADVDRSASPERAAQAERASASPPPSQYKQPMLVPCSVPITSEAPKSLPPPSSPRPSPLYQRLPVSPQSQMVPMRQASPKLQNPTAVSCSSTSNTTPLPPLVSSRIPSLVMSSQPSPRVTQPLSPNGQWSRNTLTHVGKRKSSPPPTKIAVCMPIPAHSARPETPVQQVYSTAATQQPVIQHASGMLAPVPGYPRGGLPPLTLNIPPRPYMPVPPLASGVQIKNSRDPSLGGKSVIETLLPANPNEPPQRLEEPKLSPAVIPETTHKASTSPKVPSPNQPPTYIPETAKIEITSAMPSPIFGTKPCYLTTDSYTMSSTVPSRTQKQISISITTDSNLLSPRQKQEMSNVQLLTTHVPRTSTPSPVIVAHGQSHLLHKSVHGLGPPAVSTANQPLVKTVVPVVPQQVTAAMPGDKCVITQAPLACQMPVSQSQLGKSHVPLVSTVSQSQIITRVVPSTVSSVPTSSMSEQASSECLEPPRIVQEQPLELDAEAQISQTVQPMLLTPPIQTAQPVDEIKQEPVEVKTEDTTEETEYNAADSKTTPLNQTVDDVKPKQEPQEAIKMEDSPSPVVPKVEADDTAVPKLEADNTKLAIKLEPAIEVKEEEKENDDAELDEEPAEDPLKEPDPLAIDSKDDPTDSKEDSDYWSAKEVNIESVIKKVDALCDGEGNDGDEEAQQAEGANSDSHDNSKNESDWFDAESAEGETKKSFASADDHDESAEACENEVTRSRRGRARSRRGSRGGVTTRRGRNASNVSQKRGGRSPRGSKHHVEKSKLPADVYEFHDDSEEDNAGRPRLILTIKSPGPNVAGPNAQPATPVAAVKEVPPEEFVSPAANTRKSRRLAERDRNTIDDVIEDVVRGSPASKGLAGNAGNVHATRRSTRHNNTPRNATQPPVVQLTELRKSTRGSRKATRRASENNDDSGEEKPKEVSAATQQEEKPSPPNKEEPKLAQPEESPKAEEPTQVAAPAPQKAISLEPMTLIDPVTGMLIPMRESEEGQYIPVSTSGQTQNTNKALGEPRSERGTISANSTSEAPRAKSTESASPSSAPAETKKEIVTEQPPCPPAQQIQPQTSVITKSQSPAIQVTSTVTVAQSSAPTSVVTTVIPTTAVQAVPVSTPQTKPTSFKAHVLNASKLATTTQQQVAVTKPLPPSLINKPIVQNIVKPPVQHVQSVQALNLQIPPGRVSSPSLSPCAKQAVVQLSSSNGNQGQPMSPVLNNTGVPPNPKQHLLQAAKQQQQQQTTTIVNMLPINLHSNVNAPSSRIHQVPASQPTALKGINGQPQPLNPKAHLLQAVVPPLIAGTVVSSPSPHLVNPQSISTGVSSVRPPGPKPPITSAMEPQKVELPISGCIMPTTSPQARSNPMPTFEAPLHGAGATPPGSQYGLIPPHRSQSPPLPPPAHHHVNTSQSEVVNHYGGLTRGELPPHYLHSQMLQYSQYLRAQQEALTAPRIGYHIPGTRSPHLPLDPKLETGLEDTHSPPLELRRGTRTPQDRTTDSPQVAQVYMLAGGVRLPPPPPQYNAGSNPSLPGAPVGARAGYYEPPPAHLRSQYHPMPASEAPPEMGRAATPERCRKHQVVTPPPYASQVPPQADSFQMLLQRYPLMWQGLLALKNDQAAVQMHFVFGNPNVARDSLPCNSDGSTPPLRIAQRMRLEQTQVEGVARKMQTDNEHCMLLALPCGRDEVDVLQQSKNLQSGFIMYLQQKQAAGIVNIAVPGSQQPAYVVHIFPSCDFAHENLARIAPDLLHRVAKIAHLLIVIATV